MAKEIEIALNFFSQGNNLDEIIKDLERVKQLQREINTQKAEVQTGDPKKINAAARATERLKQERAKVRQEAAKAQREEERLANDRKRRAEQDVRASERLAKQEAKRQDALKTERGIIGGLKKEARDLRKALDQATDQKEINRLNRALDKTNNTLKRVGRNTNTFEKALDSFAFKFNFLSDVASGALFSITNGFQQAALRTIELTREFEKNIVRVQALTGATDEQRESLSQLAQQLGRSTVFSAREAADAQIFLAQAGFNVQQITEALPGTLELAAAGQLDLAQAADIASNVLSAYGLETSELNRVNDILSFTAARANTDVIQLSEAFKFVAPVAKNAGVEIDQLAAFTGTLGNAGLQAGIAGRGLRTIISRLLKPSKEAATALDELGISTVTSEGQLRDLQLVFEDLSRSGATPVDIIKIFGQEAQSAASILINSTKEAREFTKAIGTDGVGFAAATAAKQIDTLDGSIKGLESAFDGLLLGIGSSEGSLTALRAIIDDAALGFRQFGGDSSEASKGLSFFKVGVEALTATLQPLIEFNGLVLEGFGNLIKENPKLSKEFGGLTDNLADFSSGLENTGTAIVPLRENIDDTKESVVLFNGVLASSNAGKAADTLKSLNEELSAAQKRLNEAAIGSDEFVEAQKEIIGIQIKVDEALGKSVDTFKSFNDQIRVISDAEFTEGVEDLIDKLDGVNKELIDISDISDVAFDPESTKESEDEIDKLTSKIKKAEKDRTKAAEDEEKKRRENRDLAISTGEQLATQFTQFLATQGAIQTDNELRQLQTRFEAQQITQEQFEQERTRILTEQARKEKSLALFEAGISTLSAVAQALPNIPLAVAAGILGAAQVSLIAATPIPQFREGGLVANHGLLKGKRHEEGGTLVEAERDEYFMPTAETREYYGYLEAMRKGTFSDYVFKHDIYPALSTKSKSTSVYNSDFSDSNLLYSDGLTRRELKEVNRNLVALRGQRQNLRHRA